MTIPAATTRAFVRQILGEGFEPSEGKSLDPRNPLVAETAIRTAQDPRYLGTPAGRSGTHRAGYTVSQPGDENPATMEALYGLAKSHEHFWAGRWSPLSEAPKTMEEASAAFEAALVAEGQWAEETGSRTSGGVAPGFEHETARRRAKWWATTEGAELWVTRPNGPCIRVAIRPGNEYKQVLIFGGSEPAMARHWEYLLAALEPTGWLTDEQVRRLKGKANLLRGVELHLDEKLACQEAERVASTLVYMSSDEAIDEAMSLVASIRYARLHFASPKAKAIAKHRMGSHLTRLPDPRRMMAKVFEEQYHTLFDLEENPPEGDGLEAIEVRRA